MKTSRNILLPTILACVILSAGCRKHHDNEKSVADRQLDKLSGDWKASGVTLDGAAKDNYTDFKLTLAVVQGAKTFNYVTVGRPSLSPWPVSGTFTFNDSDPMTQFTRNDNIPFTYEVTATTLTLQFNYAVAGFTSRGGSVKGAWEFKFEKE